MQTDSLLNQSSAREMDLAPLHYGTRTHEAPINARRPPFDGLTIGLHWGTVLLVLILFASAWLHALAGTLQSDFTPVLLQIHRSSGVTIWIITALRLAWRLTNSSLPPFPAQMTKLHRATVKLSEYGLYPLLIGQPATGLLATLFGGRPFALYFWQLPPLMPRNVTLQATFHFSQELGAWALAGLVVGHAAAVLFHHFVLRDDVLESMAPVIAMARPKQELATGHIVPETLSGNKSDPLAVLLTRRGNGATTNLQRCNIPLRIIRFCVSRQPDGICDRATWLKNKESELITPRGDLPRGQVDIAHHPDYHSRNDSCTGEYARYYGRAKQNHS